MRERIVAAIWAAVGLGIGMASPVQAESTETSSARLSFALYCSSCHGPHGEGAAGSLRPREHAPPLSDLGEKYGLPLPRARLAHFVLLDTRLGGGHLCGDRLLPDVPSLRTRGSVERMVVAEALAHLEALQHEALQRPAAE